MTSSSRRSRLSVSVPSNPSTAPPPLSALFLINFDVKAGYTIVWKRAETGVELEGLVEFKSLPSGLHTVHDDLIYFVQDGQFAGLSAFVNEPCEDESLRNARMLAVGILVPLSYGRLGRSWRHAEALKEMAAKLAKDPDSTQLLEKYWQSHQASRADPAASPVPSLPASPMQGRKGHTRKRSASDAATLVAPEHKLSPFHPAWSLAALLDRFGPLIFPIQRAALLRKRILISCHAPVHQVCDFVYNISVISNIPIAVLESLPNTSSSQRLRPLFTIGVHDIPFLVSDLEASKRDDPELMDDESKSGWVACTTDSILAVKDTLWDMLITIPPDHTTDSKEKTWPTVECPKGQPIRATQRDLRRFNALRSGLANLVAVSSNGPGASDAVPRPESAQSSRSVLNPALGDGSEEALDRIVEPQSWASLAYSGFMWWASAGEQLLSEEQEEAAQDAALLADLNGPYGSSMPKSRRSNSQLDLLMTDSISSLVGNRATTEEGDAHIELAIIAYFHRLTSQMLTVLSDLVDSDEQAYPQGERYQDEEPTSGSGENDDEEDLLVPDVQSSSDSPEEGIPPIVIDSRAVETMGLDVWSAGDGVFVQELIERYFDRDAKIEGKGVEVCGMRVC